MSRVGQDCVEPWAVHGHRSPRRFRMQSPPTAWGERTRTGGRTTEVIRCATGFSPALSAARQDAGARAGPRSWCRASGRGRTHLPKPRFDVMPGIGNIVSPVGAARAQSLGAAEAALRGARRLRLREDGEPQSDAARTVERIGSRASLGEAGGGTPSSMRSCTAEPVRTTPMSTKRSTESSTRPGAYRSGMHECRCRQRGSPRQLRRGRPRHTVHSGRRRCRSGRQPGCAIAACCLDPCLRGSSESRSARTHRRLNEAPRRERRTAGESTVTPPRRSRHPEPRSTTTQRSSRPSRTQLRCRPVTAGWIGSAAIW